MKSKLVWLWLVALLAIDVIVPWHIIGEHGRFTGAFLFWVIWALVAVVSMFAVFQRWSE